MDDDIDQLPDSGDEPQAPAGETLEALVDDEPQAPAEEPGAGANQPIFEVPRYLRQMLPGQENTSKRKALRKQYAKVKGQLRRT